jgi:precorrin-2/cobalt-factor-2 C20-methyltransferase
MGAFRTLEEADVVFVPMSSEEKRSIAGEIYLSLSKGRKTYPFWFPMTNNSSKRDAEILRQIKEYSTVWRGAKSVALPVIGDSALYATVAYLYNAWREICPELELKLLPGISAHSLASCLGGEFLSMGRERLSILPCSEEFARLEEIMKVSDCVALYKPSALGKELPKLAEVTGPWSRALRVHHAGLPEQSLVRGDEALSPTDDYLSVLLLWRNER